MPQSTVRKQYNLPRSLVNLSTQLAEGLSRPFTSYTRDACKLLGFASLQKFNVRDTKLVVNGTCVDIPSLATTPEELSEPTKHVDIHMRAQDAAELSQYAQNAHISEVERVRRALHFMNFIAQQGVLPSPTFQHGSEALPWTVIV